MCANIAKVGETAKGHTLAGMPLKLFCRLDARDLCVLNLLYDGLESGGIVEGEIGEDLAVDLDAGLVDETHELGVAEVFEASGSVDTLNPESAEVALLILAVAIGVGQTLFPGVLGNGPYVAAAAEVAAGEFEDFFTTCTRSDVVD